MDYEASKRKKKNDIDAVITVAIHTFRNHKQNYSISISHAT